MVKKSLRQQILKRMREIGNVQKDDADQWLRAQLFAHENYKAAQKIGIVLSMAHEVNTDPIIMHMLRDGKQVYVPATNYATKTMNFQAINDLSQVAVDEKGIRYVNAETTIDNALDLVIVPGVAFNKEGYRIGYGGGYFDRYLNTYAVKTISLIYDVQLCEQLPIEAHDQPVQHLIIAKTSRYGG
ncbi:5-formyltetrahydrofolate cyclo-ligase [Staphylococcus microti]|uniref:5-formyltetrahydrofolate cyclo-ligase n=1 Tax=Staphylococcus microti TaxID=569857 RepID=A0A0D6XSL1_9STAP|nr:5-formyltetrahydrofolate cyclo-ligase [Staphylococcus microti]KIX91587.1 5-formyltetrahydrofolate cyclo-ligase [Staphylococcus microti]PNZ81042.1 5-formyltetrahydrofolate cyclo-ligase [Staphylococcus microti]SUM57538.1 5-formyltetrahydrofolate cyclo-ligase [Staphylococcus microti]